MKTLVQRKRSGFTLMELLIVMFILGILLAFLLPIIFSRMNKAQIQQVSLLIAQFDQALLQYHAEHGYYPQGSPTVPRSGLAVLVGEPNPYNPYPNQGMGGGYGPSGQSGMIPDQMNTGGITPTTGGFSGDPNSMMPGMGTDPARTVGAGADPGGMSVTPIMSPTGGPGSMMQGDPMNPGGMMPPAVRCPLQAVQWFPAVAV